jgi:acyl carrier protein
MKVDPEEIRDFVRELLERKGEHGALSDGESLITSGRLDSVDVLEIVTFTETRYGLDFASRPFDPGDFDTIASIVALVSS